MPDFKSSQTRVTQARAARGAAATSAGQAMEHQRQLTHELAQLSRTLNPHDRAALLRQTDLENELKQATADAQNKQAAFQNAKAALTSLQQDFAVFTDPIRSIGSLSDQYPFLLFPVRIETRFMTVSEQPQLWVRIYPDDCSIDTFEDTLSSAELANAKLYWQAIWRAGGEETDQRAAWRNLVAAHGSGRSGWIVDHYRPANLAAEPVKASPTDEILVIPTQTPLGAAEATAISAYWQAVGKADGKSAETQAAQAALEAAVGAARAVELITDYVPYNLSDAPTPPAKQSVVTLSTAFVIFPADPPTKQDSWSQAPMVHHLADRFVVIGFNAGVQTILATGSPVSLPLIVGPNPSASPDETIHPLDGDLFIPDELQWLVDFDRAVTAGMGLKIPLTADQARSGFDRLLVIGLELSSNESDAKAALELLFQHHQWGRSGLVLVPQGTPTHNTTGKGTGYTQLDNADESFDDRKHAPLFTVTADPMAKRDGEWLSELLGIDPSILQTVHSSDGTEQALARATQCALWPATLGYWMDKLLTPIFNDTAVDNTRWFFTNYVSGRGALPAIRIGEQPYGILPTSAFSRIIWVSEQIPGVIASAESSFLRNLGQILRGIDADWTALSAQPSYVGKAGDAHQLLLDIVGLHPASVEFYSRYSESVSQLYNIMNLEGNGPVFWATLSGFHWEASPTQLLAKFGYTGTPPDILKQIFRSDAAKITTIIDDVPLSESATIRDYTDDHRNYIQWLIDAAKTSLDALYQEQGFSKNQTPAALLYLFLRHALMLGYYDSSYNLHRSTGILTTAQLQAMKPEPNFVHVSDGTSPSESRFSALYKTEPRLTSSPSLLVSDYITQHLADRIETQGLNEQLACLNVLAGASTTALERVFAEHIDCCSYRYDAWLLGLVNYRLQNMRFVQGGEGQTTRTGLYLGAYAWVEDLRRSAKLTPVQLPPDVAPNFPGSTPVYSDPSNGGYIHAPSMAQAETAAVLRSGYLANASPSNASTMAVNLSSDRVRLALSVLEGIRNGQSLGALLGYQFERGLHDEYGLAEVDKFIYPMRKAFPLVADTIAATKTDPNVPIEAIEASNVLDGLKLANQIRNSGNDRYPFGVSLPAATPAESSAINTEASALLNTYDAIGDLALAEGVHQAVQGNFGRIAGTLQTYTTGNFPPDPEVVQTPPSGIGLTHRVAVHFKSGLVPSPTATPRAMAEPALDSWLASLLPPLGDIQCQVVWKDPISGSDQSVTVSLQDLAIAPIDLLNLLKPDAVQSMAELDDRILGLVIAKNSPRPDATLSIQYMASDGNKISIFQALALLRSLKALVYRSRPLRATDARLSNASSPDTNGTVFIDSARLTLPKAALDRLGTDMDAFLSALSPLTADIVTNRAALIAGIDGFLDSAASLLDRSGRFNLNLSGWGFAFAWKTAAFGDLIAQVSKLLTRWTQKLIDCDSKIATYDALPADTNDTARFQLLSAAALDISASLDPLPAAPATMRASLDPKRAAFAVRLTQFRAVLNTNSNSFAALLGSVHAIATSDLDAASFDIAPFGDRALVFARDLVTNITGHRADIDKRSTAVQTQLDIFANAASATDQIDALQAAAKALFGPDFQIYPEFSISSAQGDEWANALALSTGGQLLQFLTTTEKLDFPVDEWLYGVARIRPNMRSWEQIVMLTTALGTAAPELTPAQFPYESNASWLALQYPDTYQLNSDHVLYTAHYASQFDKASRQCGLLIDEWTEVIPATTRNTGITFHYDRPNNEASQSFLLVTPASATGQWVWDDLVGALHETLDLAKKRAVEPVQIDPTTYSRFLPATIMAVAYYGISITTSLAAANGVFRTLEKTNV